MTNWTADYDEEPLRELTVTDLLRNRAEKIGDRTAVTYGPEDRAYSFSELNDVANAIANSLIEMGIEKQQKVSVMARNPLSSVLAMVGINKAGMVYSPINFEYKGEALSYQLNDTGPEVLIVEDQYVGRLNEVVDSLEDAPTVVVIDTGTESATLPSNLSGPTFDKLQSGDRSEPGVDVSWHDEASIVYTSGTTGMPKGVVLPYRWIFENYTLFRQQLLSDDDVVHTSLPMYHVGGVYFDLHTGWVSGASTVLWDRFSPNDFWDRIDRYEATTVTLVSVMATWLSKHGGRDTPNTLNKVHMQPLPDDYRTVAERFGFDFVTVGFGQTESGLPIAGAIHAAQGRDATPEDVRRGMTPNEIVDSVRDVGVPVLDEAPAERYMGEPIDPIVDVAIVDDHDEPVPAEAAGELVIRPKVAEITLKEYYGKPERTVEAFSNLWFHTGDTAYVDSEGNYCYLDRRGDIIRRRGENISSLQVQEITNKNSKVEKTAAYPVPAHEGGEDEVAISVEVVDGERLTESDLRAFLSGEMPEFMRPKYIQFVDDIPTTKTNKMEKYKLQQDFNDQLGE
ncbi:AMP-binding protein [Halomarina litorea]|uniref:AMP-binding protein n=1 Tax=Halomarina litorea TaxID=2961595 RepID=UPI0020C4BA41|nr:AMP-binding protein [Halomarina sp. BCD28]